MNTFTKTIYLFFVCNIASANIDHDVDFLTFCYHDVKDDVIGKLYNDSFALNTKFLINHFQWLKQNGYNVISTQMIRQAKSGQITLPAKSVLLSFDDGYNSFYTTIFPLLKQFNYPATYAIVTNWIGDPSEKINYGLDIKYKSDFMTWEQIKEVSDSGLIEIASHSHNLHQGITSNPQGNSQPAATSRLFNLQYETDKDYQQRIYNDFKTSRNLIQQHTGIAPKTLVWPYGSYSIEAWNIAKSLGYETSMVLGTGINSLNGKTENNHIQRLLIDSNPSLIEFKKYFKKASFIMPQRVIHVDLDYVYDIDQHQQDKNLNLLLDRIKKMNISTVYLQAFSDSDGDGNADALYFPNKYLPMKADLFNRVSWQLRTRSQVSVYAWMPVSSFIIDIKKQQELGILSWQNNKVGLSKNNYQRLSIFKTETKKIVQSIYASLAKHAKFAGILYHDDGILTDFEDLSPDALNYYKQQGLKFDSINDLITNKSIATEWAQIKSNALINFTNQLTKQVQLYLPEIKTARNIYAQVINNPISEQWFAQNFVDFVENYDTTAVMAMPYMEGTDNATQWLASLADKVVESNLPLSKIVFELQSRNWKSGKLIPSIEISRQLKLLQQHGISNYGYYPDDFLRNHPAFKVIFPVMSLSSYPYYKK